MRDRSGGRRRRRAADHDRDAPTLESFGRRGVARRAGHGDRSQKGWIRAGGATRNPPRSSSRTGDRPVLMHAPAPTRCSPSAPTALLHHPCDRLPTGAAMASGAADGRASATIRTSSVCWSTGPAAGWSSRVDGKGFVVPEDAVAAQTRCPSRCSTSPRSRGAGLRPRRRGQRGGGGSTASCWSSAFGAAQMPRRDAGMISSATPGRAGRHRRLRPRRALPGGPARSGARPRSNRGPESAARRRLRPELSALQPVLAGTSLAGLTGAEIEAWPRALHLRDICPAEPRDEETQFPTKAGAVPPARPRRPRSPPPPWRRSASKW